MTEQSLMSIDLARADDPAGRLEAAAQFDKAFSTLGFATVHNHGVPLSVFENAYAAAKRFFDLPMDEKLKYRAPSRDLFRGYNGPGTHRSAVGSHRADAATAPGDLGETYMIARIDDVSDPYYQQDGFGLIYAPNFWPQGQAGFREAFEDFYRSMEELARRIMRLCAIGLGAPEDTFVSHLMRHCSTCTVINYPPVLIDPLPGQLRRGPHTDNGVITLLHQRGDGPPGLQVKTRNGGWSDVKTRDGDIILNIGDLLARWTNDRWVSTPHRVVNPEGSWRNIGRQSLGYFQKTDFDALVEVVPNCLAPGQVPKYEPIVAGDWIRAKMLRSRGGYAA